MEIKTINAAMGRLPFDLLICNTQLLNVLTGELYPADIGIVGDTFAYVGEPLAIHTAKERLDAAGLYAVPGLIDSHMHIESSMMTPAHFAQAVLPLGTTTVAADPHEIGNVLGVRGVKMLCEMSRGLPLEVHVMAPSTVPSAPGYETAGCDIGPAEVAEMLTYPGVLGLGEVMDFLGVIAGDEKMMGIIAAAKKAGVLLDGHVPTLRGHELQAFAASGIDCDHTYMDPALVREKLRYGIAVQIQERFFTAELMACLNELPVQSRVMLVTDDVPISRLASCGHLDSLVRKAIALGLEPARAYRYVTINAADRLRLYRSGAVAPGRFADLVLLSSLEKVAVEKVFAKGELIAENGKMLRELQSPAFPPEAYETMHIRPLMIDDFAIRCESLGETVRVNAIEQDGATSRTRRVTRECTVENGVLRQGNLVKMAVFERHTGRVGRSLGLMANLEEFRGALATTYAHDCHNLCIFSANDSDALLAANMLIAMGGGVAAVLNGEVLCAIELPIAGILCQDTMAVLADKFLALDAAAKTMCLNHGETLTFLTLMSLAVSPEIKLTDRGIVDVVDKRFLPLIIEEREGGNG